MDFKVGMKFTDASGIEFFADEVLSDRIIFSTASHSRIGHLAIDELRAHIVAGRVRVLSTEVVPTEAEVKPVSHNPCATGHRPEHWVNVGFYTATYACKHCGCDKPATTKKLLDIDDLSPGDQLALKQSWNGIPAGSIVTVIENDGWDLTVRQDTQYGAISYDVPVSLLNDYLEYPNG